MHFSSLKFKMILFVLFHYTLQPSYEFKYIAIVILCTCIFVFLELVISNFKLMLHGTIRKDDF